jgi:carbon-monoxide dehydrogenase medium subunit
MEIADIQLHEPATVKEACDLLNEHCDTAKVLMGGTDLIVDLKQDRVTGVEHLIMLHRIEGLKAIERQEGGLRIGALVTPNQALRDPKVASDHPALCHAVRTMAAYQVRSMATICGNIASAVPSSDLAPFFVAMDSKVVLSNGVSERTADVREYFLGPRKTVCGDLEILTHLILPDPPRYSGASYQKFALRGGNALAVAGVAARLILDKDEITDACIVLGAVAPIPLIATRTNAFLKGKRPSEVNFAEAGLIAMQEARPITDIRGTIEYRRELVKVLTKRALEEACSEARTRRGD